MPSTVLITGGAGFIGSRLGRRLAGDGHHVVAMDNLHPQVHAERGRPADLDDAVTLYPGDVTSPSNWHSVLQLVQPDVVVHLAAETGTGQSLTEASRHGLVNVVGTTQLLDALHAHDAHPAHLVLASSRAVYGDGAWQAAADGSAFYPPPRRHEDLAAGRFTPCGPDGAPATSLPSRADRTEPRPTNVYAATKLAQEHILSAWCTAMGTALSVLRLQNVYGPGQSLANSYTGVVALFARLAAAGERIEVYEDGDIVRDFVFVDDVVDALVRAIAAPPAGARVLDVGSGQPTTILAVARHLAEREGAPAPEITGRFRDGDVRAASCDLSRTTAELGFEPQWDVQRGMSALLEWVRSSQA